MHYYSLFLVAHYERILLFRSRVFVILSFFVIGIILFFNLWVYSVLNVPSYEIPPSGYIFEELETTWRRFASYREGLIFLPAAMPYANAVLFSVLQSFIIIFLAGNFLSRNRKCTSNEAFDVRPIANGEYIWGKGLGVVYLLTTLNVMVVLLVFVINLFGSVQPCSVWLYLFYFFTLTLPSLLFMTGCTILVKSFIKSEFLGVLFLLSFLVVNILVIGKIYHGVADFLALRVPNLFSTIIGHPGIGSYLLQRFIFVLLGFVGIYFAIVLSKRIPGNRESKKLNVFRGSVMLGGVLVLMTCFIMPFYLIRENRAAYTATYVKYNKYPKMNIRSHDILFRQDGKQYSATSYMMLENRHDRVIDTLILYLNPGVTVRQVTADTANLSFSRDHQALVIRGTRIHPGDSIHVEIRYAGMIDESICYPEISQDEYDRPYSRDIFLNPGKRFAFLDHSYVLLTPECLWYPVSIPPVDIESPFSSRGDFTRYRLDVLQAGERLIVSQGIPEKRGDTLRFINHQDLLGIVLVAGPYRKDEHFDGNHSYEFYCKQGHYPLEGVFRHISEEMKTEVLNAFFEEWNCYAYYPYRKLCVVEVPVSFSVLKRPWRRGTEVSHPEVIFQSERTGGWVNHDGVLERARKRESGLMLSTLLKRVVNYEFDKYTPLVRPLLEERWQGENNYFLTEHRLLVSSDEFPAVGNMVRMLKTDFFGTTGYFSRQGQRNREIDAVELLSHVSLRDVFRNPGSGNTIEKVIAMQGAQMQRYILTKISWDELKSFMEAFYDRYCCQDVEYSCFAGELQNAFGIDILSYTRKMYENVGVPAFVVKDVSVCRIVDDKDKFMAKFKVWNRGNADGIITVEGCEYDPEMRTNRVFMKNYEIKAGESKAFRFPVPKYPLHLWTNFSRNLPDYYTFPGSRDQVTGGEGIDRIDTSCFKSFAGEILVDNDSPGFKIIDNDAAFFQWRKQGKKDPVDLLYGAFAYPVKWTLCVTDKAYGDEIRSLYCKSTGKGKTRVEWSAVVKDPGEYELFIYFPNISLNSLEWKFADQTYWFYHDGSKDEIVLFSAMMADKNKTLIRYSGGGEEELPFPAGDYYAPGVWVPAGRYELSRGEIKLSLQDQQLDEGMLMIADAVKWIKVNKVAKER